MTHPTEIIKVYSQSYSTPSNAIAPSSEMAQVGAQASCVAHVIILLLK